MDSIRYIPDILLSLENYSIIIEIDEYQHSNYEDIYEKERMNIIHNILSHKTIFIRFNPDSYLDENYNRIKSPWVYYRRELKLCSDKKISEEWNNRLNNLKDKIDYYINNEPKEEFTEVYLYYN